MNCYLCALCVCYFSQLVEGDVRVRKRTRTMTPQQSLDIREIAGKIEHVKLFDTDMDEADAHDPNACAIYVKEIFEYLYQLEVSKV